MKETPALILVVAAVAVAGCGSSAVPGQATSESASFGFPMPPVSSRTTVRAAPVGTVHGRVVDLLTGEGIAGARVSTLENYWIQSEFTDLLRELMDHTVAHQEVTSDAGGYFEMKLTPEDYQVVVQHPRYAQHSRNDVRVRDGRNLDLGSIGLHEGAVVRGTVVDAEGKGVADAYVHVLPVPGDWSARALHVRTDSEGSYVLDHVAPGRYRLSATRPLPRGTGCVVRPRAPEVELVLHDGAECTQDIHVGKE